MAKIEENLEKNDVRRRAIFYFVIYSLYKYFSCKKVRDPNLDSFPYGVFLVKKCKYVKITTTVKKITCKFKMKLTT